MSNGRIARSTLQDPITSQVEREGLVGDLQVRYDRLYEITHNALKYRSALRFAIRELRGGKDRASVVAVLAQWDGALRSVKKLARNV